jgi:hypothetical protein
MTSDGVPIDFHAVIRSVIDSVKLVGLAPTG